MWATAVCAAVVIAASRGVTNQLGRSKRQATTTTTKPTIARTCASFKYQEECDDKAPASLNCVWTSAEAGDFEGIRVCKEMSCEQITNAMQGGNLAAVEDACRAKNGCLWDGLASFCYTTGNTPPCSLYSGDVASCPADRCEYNNEGYICLEKGAALPCANIYAIQDCNDVERCVFYEDIYKCWDKGQKLQCDELNYYGEASCTKHDCKWVPTNQKGGFGNDGLCMAEGEVAACEVYPFDSCPEERCTYRDSAQLCWPKDRDLPCDRLGVYHVGATACALDERCTWFTGGLDGNAGVCETCTKADPKDCVQPPPKSNGSLDNDEADDDDIDPNKPCAEFVGETAFQCPEHRCGADYVSAPVSDKPTCFGTNTLVCRDLECKDFMYGYERCIATEGCTYDQDNHICSDPSKPYPCEDIYMQTMCEAGPAGDCTWTANPYEPLDDVGYNDDVDIAGVCRGKGESEPCRSFQDDWLCPKDQCEWEKSLRRCHDKGVALSCSAYTVDGECPRDDGCEWKNGICWDVDEDPPCSAFCNAFQCDSSGKCLFDQNEYICKECSGGDCPTLKECSEYTDYVSCPTSECEFVVTSDYDDVNDGDDPSGVEGFCVDKVCAGIYDQEECTAHNSGPLTCTWNGGIGSAPGRCAVSGYTLPCSMLFGVGQCESESRKAECVWNSDNYICQAKAMVDQECHTFTPATCPTGDSSKCEVVTRDSTGYQACQVKQSLKPATPPPTTGAGDGNGNEDVTKCSSDDYNAVSAKLEVAGEECVIVGRRRQRQRRVADGTDGYTADFDDVEDGATAATAAADVTEEQLECLAYFLSLTPNPTTVAKACPCLWFHATEVQLYDNWMKIKC